ncbi:ABC transporter ATP-binding protein [Alicyclobacillus dauci]|uniref:ABC transporter ATP-binding protein n=1 Tax=Alicyclobacillus dauci TaxID=1475485 RepID=A0ABY6Z8F2_9BACL|nr:ABC transporter ATP-binding protein [Alicyclobacillus dauci]WAH38857.1 ABC transporter ATP-binding protein [Alicyclobacillus dauci]
MATIELQQVTKRFGSASVLKEIDLEVNDREFFVLFGPAGAGKTSTLNVIAGIEPVTSGSISFDGVVMNQAEPWERNVAMVFENYALYPHLSVKENIMSPLIGPKMKWNKADAEREAQRIADMLGIGKMLDRKPSQLSNGQRQRIALGRVLVRSPNVFLMDEPLTHLDAKLRHAMRTELKEMQRNLNTTTIYVTHDYLEALSLGNRIAVVNEGMIEQVGTPEEVYYSPATEFVARSFGEPEINILKAKISSVDGVTGVSLLEQESRFYEIPEHLNAAVRNINRDVVHVGIRPRQVRISKDPKVGVQATVFAYEPIGAKATMTLQLGDTLIQTIQASDLSVQLDDVFYVDYDTSDILIFDPETGRLIASSAAEGRGL